jgi:hypothetical protein
MSAMPGADALVEGYYLLKRRRAQRVDMPVRIWFGAPLDENGDELDRSPRWQVMIAGTLLGEEPFWIGGLNIECLADLWPACAAEPIDLNEYEFRMARAEWAAEHDPLDPFGTPGGRIDPMTAPLPFT